MMTTKTNKKENFIQEKYQHPFSILIIFLSLVIFFNQNIFDGKVFISGDTIASQSFENFSKESAEKNIYPLWNPYIFCGMPGYGSLTIGFERTFDISAFIYGKISHAFNFIFNNKDLGWELFYYLLLGIGTYFFAFYKLKNKIAALVSALGVMHSTFIIILITVGHMTKVPVIAFFPIIFLLIEQLKEKISLQNILILILAIHFMFLPSHLQMIFYIYFSFGIYYLFSILLSFFKKENFKKVFQSGLIFGIASIFSFLMTSDQYLSTIEYSKYSIRGTSPITENLNKSESTSSNSGLDYDYATNWSFSPEEIFTFFVPSTYGFGNHTYKGVLTQNQPVRLNTYFGQQPFTDAPQYMGIAILIFAIIGFWKNRKNNFVQFLAILILISILISFGKFSIFYDAMFYYFPYFNKFRIPSMILILVQLTIPLLAGYGVKSILENNYSAKTQKTFFIIFVATAGLFLLSFAGKEITISIYQSFFGINDLTQKFQGADPNTLNAFFTIISDMVAVDVFVLFLITALVFGLSHFYLKKQIASSTFAISIIAIILFDLWRINYKPYEAHPKRFSQNQFSTPEHVNFLLQDKSLYRIIELENGQPPYNNKYAYWKIQNAYGYQGAKMRNIQDMFDVVGIGNPLLLKMMNVKYIVNDGPDSLPYFNLVYKNEKIILQNNDFLPRAFFVNRFEKKSGIEILNKIKNLDFNPRDVAYVTDDVNLKIDTPTSEARVEFTKYETQNFEIKINATGNNLLFLSESWYPKGWKTFLDEKEIPIYKLNYMFRGVVVNKGEHVLKMKFEPESFYLGKNLSLWSNILILAGLLFLFSKKYFTKKN